jgi:3-oxo-5-alpha-steroid 4-dehydrogenase 1
MILNEHDFNRLVVIWILLALPIFLLLLKIKAPYGKFNRKSWKPQIPARYGWVIMELPSLLIFSTMFLYFSKTFNPITFSFFLFWAMHYTNRSIIYPLRNPMAGKSMPLLIVVFAIFFNAINASVNGFYLGNFADYPINWFYDIRFISGAILFLFGFYINNQSDTILLQLKSSGGGYKIPMSGMFRYVSCPNYLGEIMEWCAFALMVWSLPALSFAIWTIANLFPRAILTHNWYKEYFPDYPENRKAVIPFII